MAEKIDRKGISSKKSTVSQKGLKKTQKEIFGDDFLLSIDKQVNIELLRIIDKKEKLLRFQGEHGAYGELASYNFSTDYYAIPCQKFGDIVEGVQNSIFSAGLLPVENSIEGPVNEVNDLLICSDLKIIGEVYQSIEHCLLTIKETNYREIKHVYSHPQALAQCRGFILRNQLEAFHYYDTAGAARMLFKDRPAASAAIASKLCAELYDLEIIKENITDKIRNFTRFLVVAKKMNEMKGNKSSIIFAVKHKAGALCSILELFKKAKINLTRIESRPFKDNPGNYVFFVDFNGFDQDDEVKQILKEVKVKTLFYKFLGCYQGKSIED